jgi:hypothetical protein
LGFRITCCRGINDDELCDGGWLAPSNTFRIPSCDDDDGLGRGCSNNRYSRRGALLNEIGDGYSGVTVADNGPHVDGGEYIIIGVAAAHEHGVIIPVEE